NSKKRSQSRQDPISAESYAAVSGITFSAINAATDLTPWWDGAGGRSLDNSKKSLGNASSAWWAPPNKPREPKIQSFAPEGLNLSIA
ncbi:MAG TPA: hypothetical protein VMG13_04015, partial [Trebonia sp.]|nr:hypothetical protein [Trebonia sp.]